MFVNWWAAMSNARGSIRLRDLLAIVLVMSLVAGILLPVLSATRRKGRTRSCTNNLRQLGTYLVMYVSKFNHRAYPPAAGEGFLDTLRNTPNTAQAIVRGNDGLFVCKVRGTRASPTALDYREPGPGLPGGRVSDGITHPG